MLERTVIVTGATGGVGASVCRTLASTYTVIAVGRNESALAGLANEVEILPIAGDLTDPTFRVRLSERVPKCSAIVHSAGVSRRKPHDEITVDDWTEIFSINLFAVQQMNSLFMARIRASKGDIIFLNSGAGQFSSRGNSLYSSSKHALKAYANSLREEERENGVRVTSVYPGYMDTAMVRDIARDASSIAPTELMVPVETVASAIATALAAPSQAMFEELTIRPTTPVVIR